MRIKDAVCTPAFVVGTRGWKPHSLAAKDGRRYVASGFHIRMGPHNWFAVIVEAEGGKLNIVPPVFCCKLGDTQEFADQPAQARHAAETSAS